MNLVWHLSQVDLFDGMSHEEMMQIAKDAHDTVCSHAELLYSPHDGRDRHLFIVKEGEVLLYHADNGKKKVFDAMGPGCVFGNFMPDTQSVEHYAEAQPGSHICVLTSDDVHRISAHHPELFVRLLSKFSAQLRDYERKLKIDSGSARERILGELKRYHRKRHNPLFRILGEAPLSFTHEKIAERTGLNRVTVTRTLKVLKLEGFIDIDGNGGIHLRSHPL